MALKEGERDHTMLLKVLLGGANELDGDELVAK